jgi:hypothetical protein
MEFAASTAGHV